MSAAQPDVLHPESWEGADPDVMLLCPVCVVAVPQDFATEHVAAKHQMQVREAIRNAKPEGIVADFMLKGSYEEQIAALHAQQYWEQDEVERALGAIYAFQGTGWLSVLESTWDVLHRAALEWWQGRP